MRYQKLKERLEEIRDQIVAEGGGEGEEGGGEGGGAAEVAGGASEKAAAEAE